MKSLLKSNELWRGYMAILTSLALLHFHSVLKRRGYKNKFALNNKLWVVHNIGLTRVATKPFFLSLVVNSFGMFVIN